MAKTKSKKKSKLGWIILPLFVFYLISPKEETENTETVKSTETFQENEKNEVVLSDKELFINSISNSSEFVSTETASTLYDFLKNELLFNNIDFNKKSAVGNILFEINADNYSLMVSVDNDGIYSVRCGSYDLYDGNSVIITKKGLDNRNLEHKSEYYVIAQEIVSNNLKSPKSAVFPSLWSDEVKMKRNDDIIIVQSYVDAQNSFGASLRIEWLVEFKIVNLDTFSYEIIYINIDGTTAGEFKEID